jgi:hypothetical protein
VSVISSTDEWDGRASGQRAAGGFLIAASPMFLDQAVLHPHDVESVGRVGLARIAGILLGALDDEEDVRTSAQLSSRTFCTFRREFSSRRRPVSCRRTARDVFGELSAASERPMIIFHDDGAPAAALRPQASGSRPTHRGYDYRHGSRGPSLDGPWVGGSARHRRSW